MKKALILTTAFLILFSLSLDSVVADFWQRPEDRVREITHPEHFTSEKHNRLPTKEPTPNPTSPQPTEPVPTQVEPTTPFDPTQTPVPPVGGVDGDGEDDNGDNGDNDDRGKAVEEEQQVVALPPVLGLSDTSTESIIFSDIMLLAGILCLTLYIKSKAESG